MKDWLKRLERWHQTYVGLLVFGLAELALAYLFLNWAIDTGSLLDWACVIILVIGAINNFVKLAWRMLHRAPQ